MIILGIEFLALIVICYVFYLSMIRDQVSEDKGKLSRSTIAMLAILIFIAMAVFASWYVNLGLAS